MNVLNSPLMVIAALVLLAPPTVAGALYHWRRWPLQPREWNLPALGCLALGYLMLVQLMAGPANAATNGFYVANLALAALLSFTEFRRRPSPDGTGAR